MKILLSSYYYKPHIGGIETSLENMSKVLINKGHDVTIFTSNMNTKGSKKRLPKKSIDDGIKIVRFNSFNSNFAPLYFIEVLINLTRIRLFRIKYLHEKFDILLARNHLMFLGLGSGIGYNRFFHPASTIIELEHRASRGEEHFLKQKFKSYYLNFQQYLQIKAFNFADKIILFSENLKAQVLEQIKVDEKKIRLIKPGINPDFMNRSFIIRKQKKPFTFLILGRIIKCKGIDIALNAIFKLMDKDCRLMIVGDGSEKKNLISLYSKLNLQTKVNFYEGTHEPEKYYKSADVFLMTSLSESFGQTIIEAMAHGLPIIAFKSSDEVRTASEEIITDNINGFLIDKSIENLANMMNRVMNLTALEIETIRKCNIEKANHYYTWESFTNELLQLPDAEVK